jgi:hypothetical protein
LGLPHDAGRAYAGWGDSLVTQERYEEARTVYDRMLAYSRKVQTGMFTGVSLVQLGYLDWWAGRWRQAWVRRQEIEDWMETFPGASFAKVWASNLLGLMYNDTGQPERAYAVLAAYTSVARSAQEPQTTVPHFGQLARCVQPQTQVEAFVKEILSLTDAAAYPPYEVLPAMTLACTWLAQNTGGDATAAGRLERVHEQLQKRQSAASLYEVRAVVAGIRGEWERAVLHYEIAATNWEALKRPYDQLRVLVGWRQALARSRAGGGGRSEPVTLESVRQNEKGIVDQLANELDDPALKDKLQGVLEKL